LKVLATLVENAVNACKAAEGVPPLDSAEFDFKVETSGKTSADVEAWVVTAGVSTESKRTTDIVVTYKVPEKPKIKSIEMMGLAGLSDTDNEKLKQLQQQITDTVINNAQAAKAVPAINEAKFESLTVSLECQVTWTGEVGVKIPWKIVFSPKIEGSRATTQSIKLVFKETAQSTASASPTATPVPHP